MKTILLIIGLVMTLNADFTRSGDMVVDTTTGLIWQDDSYAGAVSKIWIKAIEFCDKMTLGGYNDWRLPNIKELKSISDLSKHHPAISAAFRNYTMDRFYWSSTAYEPARNKAWTVDPTYGYDYQSNKTDGYNTRCVRGGI